MAALFASLAVKRSLENLPSLLLATTSISMPSAAVASNQGLQNLRMLESTMGMIHRMLDDAELHWNLREESAILRLKELKDLAYDANDVVEEYEYEVNRCRVDALQQQAAAVRGGSYDCSTSRCKRKKQDVCYEHGIVAVPSELVLRARKVTERFTEMKDYHDIFSLSENDGERKYFPDIRTTRPTSSIVYAPRIVGREADQEKVIEKLMAGSGEGGSVRGTEGVSVFAIVGMGGLGKTTLAKLVYNNSRVRQSFDKLAWVYVSENFDVIKITRNIITSLTKESCEYTELEDLQGKLADEINGKRILLVLDDVWNDDRRDSWGLLCAPLSATRKCQIIVTTRSEAVAMLVQTVPFYRPNCLSFDDSWSLFKQVAFRADKENNALTELVRIGNSIVRKCKGLPLAIKTLGSMLRHETDKQRWENILESELWDLEQPQNEVLPALELSYKHMPIRLRPCFLALSLFHKVSSIPKNDVMKLWKVLDLLHYDGNDEIGEIYFTELVERSIMVHDPDDNYCLHDLLHDLACSLAGEAFYRFEAGTSAEIPENVQYMSISVPAYVKSVEFPITPCSLRAIVGPEANGNVRNAEPLFLKSKKLRAIDLTHIFVEAFPDSLLGSLKLLRHLSLNTWRDLPFILPSSMFHLYNLQYVELRCNYNKVSLNGIGRLINAHTLPIFHITRCGCGYNIRDLRNINKIRDLDIYGLDSVSCVEDANEARLQSKRHLRSLELDFSSARKICKCTLLPESSSVPQDQLLERLQPNRNLSELKIRNYKSHVHPCWLGDDSYSKLSRIELKECNFQHIGILGRLPFLKYLILHTMNSVEYIGSEIFRESAGYKGFPSLTELTFQNMPVWSEWYVHQGEFPCLHTLSSLVCPKLRSLPSVPFLCLSKFSLTSNDIISVFPASSTLRTLNLHGCSNLSSIGFNNSLSNIQLHHSSSSDRSTSAISTLPKLTDMTLSKCPNVTAVVSLPSLTTLTLRHDLRDEILYRMLNDHPSLEVLTISELKVASIALKQQSLPSLRRLCLDWCDHLQNCDGLTGLTSLQHLQVLECPKLTIHDLHSLELKTLVIENIFDPESEDDET